MALREGDNYMGQGGDRVKKRLGKNKLFFNVMRFFGVREGVN